MLLMDAGDNVDQISADEGFTAREANLFDAQLGDSNICKARNFFGGKQVFLGALQSIGRPCNKCNEDYIYRLMRCAVGCGAVPSGRGADRCS